MNVLRDYNPFNNKLSQKKTPKFDRYNPIMSWGKKISFHTLSYVFLE